MNSDFIRTIDLFSGADDEICASLVEACTPLALDEGELHGMAPIESLDQCIPARALGKYPC